MASELERKEAFLKVWFDAPENIHWAHGMSNGVEKDISDTFDRAIAAWNTRPAPAATDTGLVTVGYMVSHDAELGPVEDAVVYRSQADELLAAERGKVAALTQAIAHETADNAAKDARVEALEADLKTFQDGTADLVNEKIDAEFRAVDLEAKLAAAEKVLEAIAALSATDMSFGDQVFAVTSARAVLGGKPS